MEIWMTVISTMGFPIAVSIALFWYINKQDERHNEEMKAIKEAIENNTKVITELSAKIGGMK